MYKIGERKSVPQSHLKDPVIIKHSSRIEKWRTGWNTETLTCSETLGGGCSRENIRKSVGGN